ncbi:MAG: hypothetical protein ACI4GO_00630 [Hominenteromicrobium sp.]
MHRSAAFTIAGISFVLEADREIAVTEPFRPFLGDPSAVCYTARFCETDHLPEQTGRTLYAGTEYRIIQRADGGVLRCNLDPVSGGRVYAVSVYEEENRRVVVQYVPEYARCFSETGNSFFHLGWEGLMLRESRLILHASCVDTPLGGILFSGPSGVGKSTQAELWRRYEGGKLINGDRPILCRTEHGWRAYGSPYAGSSHCHIQANCPIRAIAVLKQAQSCSVRRLQAGEAFRRLFSGMVVYSWDAGFVTRACDLTAALAADIPVYELSCTPDRRAVEAFKARMIKEGLE